MRCLLEAGANPNAKGPDGTTLLHQAARLGNLEMIRALAKAKVDFTQKNDDGFTALDVAEGKKAAVEPARAPVDRREADAAVDAARASRTSRSCCES